MSGRVPLMGAGNRRALGDVSNQLGGGHATRHAGKEAVKCVSRRLPRPILRVVCQCLGLAAFRSRRAIGVSEKRSRGGR
jgi:hypothetical protein